jgi:lysophospholipase L1-like esterase
MDDNVSGTQHLQSTMRRRLLMLLGATLVGSTAANVALLVALRSMYIESKIQATQPNLNVYTDANASLRTERPAGRRAVLFGDSRIAQWVPAPSPDGDWQVINRGRSGETTAQMRWRFANDVVELRPQVVVIQAGINDLVAASLAPPTRRRQILQQCIDNLLALVAEADANGIEVILLGVFPPATPPLHRRLVWSDSIVALVEEVNDSLEQLGSVAGVTWMDSSGVLKQPDGSWYDGVSKDTLHLTSAGYERLNAAVTPLLEQALRDAVQ